MAKRERVVATAVLWVSLMLGVSFAAGCYGRNCEGDVQTFGSNPGEGRLLRADLWESSPQDGVWLAFPKQRAWIFDISDIAGRQPQVITPYISAQASPNVEPGGGFTVGGGNLTEISGVQKGRFVVKNGTCADYFLRVVVEAAPSTPPAPPASTAPPALTADASADGPAVP